MRALGLIERDLIDVAYGRVFRLALAALALALLVAPVAGCRAAPGWQGSVKIGLVVPFYGYDSGSANAAYFATKLALKERNDRGGIGGRWVELIALDDQNSPEVAAQRASEMAQDPGVLGVIGHLSSDTALAGAVEYRRAGVPAISLGGSASELGAKYPEMLRQASDDASLARDVLEAVGKRTPIRRMAIVHDADPGHAAIAAAFLAEANRVRLPISGVSQIEKARRDFVELLANLSPDPPDLVVFVGDQFQAAALTSQAHRAPAGPRILIAGCANTVDFARIVGGSAVGVLHSGFTPGAGSPAGEQFVARYRSAYGLPPAPFAFAAYDATVHLLDSIDNAARLEGRLDRGTVGRLLRSSTGDKFQNDGGRTGVRALLYEIDESGYPGKLWR